ncbi:Calcineurin-like phosphoesterase [Planctomycetes bacterium Poly30]|uniref:Calcineurin-like phosphoesterase n=1 Tax=Saltatorellus ferox TaxID=2528018 RepID=A0A518EXK8_9BACT|nr:Calcineurin-like phosphoesterase [Planctomycetes bacterium Poly30]
MRDHILFLTDLHFWTLVRNPLQLLNKRFIGNANVYFKRRHHFPLENARPFARFALETGARTVIIGGDLTSTASRREFELAVEFIEHLTEDGVDVHVIPGNHDVYTFESVRQRRFEQYCRPWIPKEGFPARRALAGGTEVVLLSTVRANFVSSKGEMSLAAITRAGELIRECQPGPVLVFGHYPLLNETAGYTLTKNRRMVGAERLRETMAATDRQVLYVAGHVHRHSSTRDPEFPNLHHVTSPALFNHWGPVKRFGGFLELKAAPAEIEVRHHWKEGKWLSEAVE